MVSLILELVSLFAIGFGIWRLTDADRKQIRYFVIAAMLLVLLPALQLIPLPPGLWSVLPGHDFYIPALRDAGVANIWRPLSLAPDRTLASLFALLPIVAAALLFAPLDVSGRMLLLNILLACLAISACVAISQIAVQGPYFYSITNRGSGVGFFSNRNHHALFVAIGILFVIGRWRAAELGVRRTEVGVISAGVLFLIFPLLTIIGSRSGLLAGVLAYVGGGVVFLRYMLVRQPVARRWGILAGVVAIAIATLILTLVSSRLTALDRLVASDASDLRAVNLPAVWAMLIDFFPFGAGLGTFDPVFRQFEPYGSLSPAYFNHAHNDWLETVIEGGIFALAMLVSMLVLMIRKAPILQLPIAGSKSRILAKVGYLGLLLIAIGSLVDYPLRTPFMGVLSMLLATWCFGSPQRNSDALGSPSHIG